MPGGRRDVGRRARARLSERRAVRPRLGCPGSGHRHRDEEARGPGAGLGLAGGHGLLHGPAALAELHVLGLQRHSLAPRLWTHGGPGRVLRSVRGTLRGSSGMARRAPAIRLGAGPRPLHLGRRGVGARALPGGVSLGIAGLLPVSRPAGHPDRRARWGVRRVIRRPVRELRGGGGVRATLAPGHPRRRRGCRPRGRDPRLRDGEARRAGGQPAEGPAHRAHAALRSSSR